MRNIDLLCDRPRGVAIFPCFLLIIVAKKEKKRQRKQVKTTSIDTIKPLGLYFTTVFLLLLLVQEENKKGGTEIEQHRERALTTVTQLL